MSCNRRQKGLCYVREANVTGKSLGKLALKLEMNRVGMDGSEVEVVNYHTGDHMYTLKYEAARQRWCWLREYDDGRTSWIPVIEPSPRQPRRPRRVRSEGEE